MSLNFGCSFLPAVGNKVYGLLMEGFINESQQNCSHPLCSCFPRCNCLSNRTGGWCTVGRVCHGRSISGTVPSHSADYCTDPGGAARRNDIDRTGTSRAHPSELVAGIPLADLVCAGI